MKICAIGPSHLGAWKRGWDVMKKDHPQHQIIFFGKASNRKVKDNFTDLAIDGDKIFATTPGAQKSFAQTAGTAEINVPDYDAFVI